MNNPLSILWNGSLLFLSIVVAIVAFPFTLLATALAGLAVLHARHQRERREQAYAWPTHNPRRRRASGYRRRRHGRFYS